MRRNPFVYYGKKTLVFLLSVFILSVAVFYISRLAPGDPLMSYYGERVEKMSVAEKEAAREKMGLNDPIVKGINYLFFASSLLLINVYNHQGVIIKILCCISIVLIIVLDFLPLK